MLLREGKVKKEKRNNAVRLELTFEILACVRFVFFSFFFVCVSELLGDINVKALLV